MKRNKTTTNRQGAAALTVVLVCVSVIGALVFASLQTSLRQRRQLDRELQMEQTRWLAEAGLGHAVKLLESDDELAFEPIVIKPKLGDRNTAEVAIEFAPTKDTVEIQVSAWIGRVDRPETQTKQTFSKTFNRTNSEKTDSTSEE